MLQDNSLSNRLNAVKKGKPIPPAPKTEEMYTNPTVTQLLEKMSYKEFFNEGYKIFQVLITSILYGYGLSALFSTDWNILGTLGVGLISNHLFTNLINFLLKLFKK